MTIDTLNLDIFLGKKVKIFRNKMNWPLKTLADQLSISVQQLQRYEQGINKISASLLYEIARIFKIPILCFFEGYGVEENKAADEKQGYNLLLIEDDLNDEFLFRKALTDFPENLNIYTIHDGDSALRYFRSLSINEPLSLPRPDLIFMDIYLPFIKGLSLLKDVKSRVILQDIPVIMLSNSLSIGDIKESYHLKASGFIRKSFSFDEFKDQLHKTLMYWIETVMLPTQL